MPLSQNDYDVIKEVTDMLRQLSDFEQFSRFDDVIGRLDDSLATGLNKRKPIIHFDSVKDLKGLELLSPLYRYIDNRQTVRVMYQSFKADEPMEIIFYPYLLKEFRNRWFIVGSANDAKKVFNLALDRIVSVEHIDVKYVESPNFDPEHFFDNVIGVSTSVNSYPRRIKFWVSKDQSKYIKTKPLHHFQKLIQENPDGRTNL